MVHNSVLIALNLSLVSRTCVSHIQFANRIKISEELPPGCSCLVLPYQKICYWKFSWWTVAMQSLMALVFSDLQLDMRAPLSSQKLYNQIIFCLVFKTTVHLVPCYIFCRLSICMAPIVLCWEPGNRYRVKLVLSGFRTCMSDDTSGITVSEPSCLDFKVINFSSSTWVWHIRD